MPDALEFGHATPDEINTMVVWAAREGWNPGDHDAACFRTADPNGFWVARQEGEMAACMSLVTYDDRFAFLGFYITKPELRGQGIGYALWQHALDACPATTIGLDGVVDQQDNYRKSGFVLAHRNIRYGGVPSCMAKPEAGIAPFDPTHMAELKNYDRACFPADRSEFLENWVRADAHVTLVAHRAGELSGYGVIRPCREGHKIGPLFADDPETAENLFDGLVSRVSADVVFIDPPELNTAAVEFCQRRGLEPVFVTARMYRGTPPELPLQKTFGITTFELG